jgi:hypothetical protein
MHRQSKHVTGCGWLSGTFNTLAVAADVPFIDPFLGKATGLSETEKP